MFKKKEYPVFLIKGFLEAGKTQFIKDAVITDGFHQRGDTLLFLLEEGIEEYPKKLLEENSKWVKIYEGFCCAIFVRKGTEKESYQYPKDDLQYFQKIEFDTGGKFGKVG